MTIINGHISKCCGTSVSGINGSTDEYAINRGALPYHHYQCNKCKKVTEKLEVPMWELTDKLKYRLLTKEEINLVVSN